MTRLLVLLTAAGLALGACGEVQNNPDASAGNPDAAPGIDGSASPPDANPDAQTIGPVTVNVLSQDSDGLPEPGATVLFYGPDGTLADRKLTDGSGNATADLEIGGSVTVVRLRTNNTYFTTVTGVKPNDVVTVGRLENPSSEQEGTMRLTLPTFTNADWYYVDSGCGWGSAASNVLSVNLYGCNGSADLLARVRVGSTYYYLGQDDATMTVDGDLDLSGESWSYLSETNFNLSLTNIPAGLDWVSAMRRTLSQHGAIFSDSADGLQSPQAGSTAMAMGYPQGVGDGTLVEVSLEKYGKNHPQIQRLGAKLDSVPSSYGMDLGTLLPWVEQPVFDGADITWTGGPGGDGVILDLRMSGSVEPYTWASWRVVLPPGTTSFTLPALPADLEGRWTSADASYYGDSTIIDVEMVDGYDQFRPEMEPYVDWAYWDFAALLREAPAGSAAVSTTFYGGD